MVRIERPYLLDVTRLVARSWTRRLPTGIDRVCYAYLRHFAAKAHLVVQHRGAFRILTQRHSDTLFAMLAGDDAAFRRRLMRFAPKALAAGASGVDGDGMIYINVSHTDFDLDSHTRWIERCALRPAYLIHDLIPITNAEYCRPHAVKRHRGRVVNALRTAAGIIVNSAATADDLAGFARQQGLPMPPTLAVTLAGADVTGTAGHPDAGKPYFLCVGTIEPRKNHLMLLRVWKRLIEAMGAGAPHLVIVGQWGANSQSVREALWTDAALRCRVRVLDRCSDADLGQWMSGAQAVLMPTLAEGFGLPMAEALKQGKPVIASDIPCFREIGQGIPLLLDPRDDGAWERTVATFGEHGHERRRQLAAMAGYRASTWERHFLSVESWLQTLPPHPRRKATAYRRSARSPALDQRRRERGFSSALLE